MCMEEKSREKNWQYELSGRKEKSLAQGRKVGVLDLARGAQRPPHETKKDPPKGEK
jgi:hypothetical protein